MLSNDFWGPVGEFKGTVKLIAARNDDRNGSSFGKVSRSLAIIERWWNEEGCRDLYVMMIYMTNGEGKQKRGNRETYSVTAIWRNEEGMLCLERRDQEWWILVEGVM